MKNPIARLAIKRAREKAKWIDATFIKNIPKWKVKIIKKYPSIWVTRLLGIDGKILMYPLSTGNFGSRVVLKLNGKIIGEKYFK